MTYKPPRIVDSAGDTVYHQYNLEHHAYEGSSLTTFCRTSAGYWVFALGFKVIAREIRKQRHTTNGYICGNWKTHEDMYGEPTMDQWWYSGVIALNESKHMPDFLPSELATLESKWHPLPHDVKE